MDSRGVDSHFLKDAASHDRHDATTAIFVSISSPGPLFTLESTRSDLAQWSFDLILKGFEFLADPVAKLLKPFPARSL